MLLLCDDTHMIFSRHGDTAHMWLSGRCIDIDMHVYTLTRQSHVYIDTRIDSLEPSVNDTLHRVVARLSKTGPLSFHQALSACPGRASVPALTAQVQVPSNCC